MSGNITTIRRNVKNVAYNYSDAQVKVREATSNDPWGPSSSLMTEVAEMTYNAMAFSDIMQMIWKRLNDHGKNWRHVYKSLVLLDYLIKTGSEKVAQQCKENIYAIQTLKDFQHIEDNKDQGMNVREKAKHLVSLLKDDERLKNERARALMAKKRFAQNSMGISSDGSTHRMNRSDLSRTDDDIGSGSTGFTIGSHRTRRDSEFEEARPTSSGEEELQLQIALALSKEEAAKEEEARKGDDVRLQLALSESQQNKKTPNGGNYGTRRDEGAGGSTSSALDDLLSLNPPPRTQAAAPQTDPWGGTAPGATASGGAPFDPWTPVTGSRSPPSAGSAQSDPWGGPPSYATATGVASPPTGGKDPWMLSGVSGRNSAPVEHDPFAPLPISQQNGNGALNNDAWSMEPLQAELTMGGEMGGSRKNVKTPETFLGENSALVNLDNLMGPSKPAVSATTQQPNPFLSAVGGGSGVNQPNPFLAAQRPSPTINEMRAQQSQQPSGPSGDWGLPPPLLPAGQAGGQQGAATGPSTNPFL